jgi:hypothetical protein
MALDLVDHLLARLDGSGVEQNLDGLAGEFPAETQNEDGDGDGGDGVGVVQPRHLVTLADPGGGEAEQDGESGPDIRGEVQGVGLESGAAVTFGDDQKLARAPVIDDDRGEQDGEGPDGESLISVGWKKMRSMAS